jgi:hypothetical protein
MKTLLIVTVMLTSSARAEQLCFRTSECDVGEVCQAIRGSAMGLCRDQGRASQSYSGKTWGVREQQENAWTKPDAGFDEDDGGDE